MASAPSSSRGVTPLTIAFAGMAALASAMGIGRFAFTPLLPMMLHDGVVDIPQGSWLATANYAGYLAGALLYMALPWLLRRLGSRLDITTLNAWLVRAGLVATALLTAGLALPWPASWPALRLLAGITSALVFLGTVNWCMARLAQLHAPAVGGMVFCGPGLGIALTGLSASAMVAAQWTAAQGWAVFALLACMLCAGVWRTFSPQQGPHGAGPAVAAQAAVPPPRSAPERALLAVAYGLAGLGYIVTATFLPVIARAALPAGSVWPDLFWPLFGMGVAMGAALSTRAPVAWDRRWLLLVAYLLQAAAIGLSLVWPGVAGFALGSWLLGLPFTAITFFGLQEARRVWPSAGDSFTGLLTAAYGLGQIIGPPMVAWTLHLAATPSHGFTQGLVAAAAALLLGAALYAVMVGRWPLRPR